MKNVAILGSTGSVGEQSLDAADRLGMRVSAISAKRNVKKAEEQARRFCVASVAMVLTGFVNKLMLRTT